MSIENTKSTRRFSNVFRLAESVLGGRIESSRDTRVSAWLPLQILAMMVACGLMYGAVMGSFSNFSSRLFGHQSSVFVIGHVSAKPTKFLRCKFAPRIEP
jgi:hypothetical protein